ncbi:hypothetical protein H9636_07060 [Ureibacillus sp. Re31]|uniref:Phage protein Gp138 N-terminal domain-containing protein n=1 Tax=Ureibacillus galli TaxID=2762222 RepID=A0ABR8XAR1_9BACL|nr:Gp138 family membrane-puncturing spike protein [Ureibacillus galli]MBD8026416.1 hypothetical protein [Ureibacillus galli]
MSNATVFFQELKRGILTSINTCMPAKILEYDKNKCEAKIQPLFKIKVKGKDNPVTLPPIEGVPALKNRYEVDGAIKEYKPIYNKGEIVLVVFSQRALDDAQNGDLVYPGTARMFSIHDAVIMGVF